MLVVVKRKHQASAPVASAYRSQHKALCEINRSKCIPAPIIAYICDVQTEPCIEHVKGAEPCFVAVSFFLLIRTHLRLRYRIELRVSDIY